MNNNESNLNKAIAAEFDMKAKDADAIVDFLQDWIVRTAKREGAAKLDRYGKFVLVERDARKGRNPRTGEAIDIAASTSIKFVPFKQTRDILNGGA